jgi:hypothetical protein
MTTDRQRRGLAKLRAHTKACGPVPSGMLCVGHDLVSGHLIASHEEPGAAGVREREALRRQVASPACPHELEFVDGEVV